MAIDASSMLNLSPSLQHRELMARLPRTLGYTGGKVGDWQERLRPVVRDLLGSTFPATPRPLAPRLLWRRETALGVIEKISFASEPGCDVLAYLCLPATARPPYDLFICLQGHNTGAHVSVGIQREDEGVAFQAEGDRDFGLECMRRGIAALCIEQRAFGDRREQHQEQVSGHGCHDATAQALMLGRTLVGERVYDVDRAIDYLETRGDIAMDRIGIMGNSGGGTVTIYAAATLPRIRFAMPSCSFSTFADSIMSIFHCADNYVPNMLKYAEMPDCLGLFAPKSLVIVTGVEDTIFPLDGVRRGYAALREIYTAAGAADRLHLVEGQGGHRFYAADGWPVMQAEMARG